MNDNKDATGNGPDANPSFFTIIETFIKSTDDVGVIENKPRCLKTDAMLTPVGAVFGLVPLKAHRLVICTKSYV